MRWKTRSAWMMPSLSLLTFIFSWAALYPPKTVERWYSHFVFLDISRAAGEFADSVPFSWLDAAIPAGVIVLAILIRKRRWALIVNLTAALYLGFFWTWGLNYHREPLSSKLEIDRTRTRPEAITEFTKRAAAELNRLYPQKQNDPYDEMRTRAEAAQRVRRIVEVIDGASWQCASRVKISIIAGPWFRAAGIDGVFNPIGQEPVINNTLLDVERPFVMAHELAHVRGYPDEGDANVIAALATLVSDDPRFQYSGWINLWLYLRNRDTDKLLDPGPRKDVQRIFDRARREQVQWVDQFQRALLDWFLKANSVDEGVRSYSRVVLEAAGSQPYWSRFR